MSQLYLFRNVLLVSLIAILIYIMYKRLIHLLQRQHVQAKYPALDTEMHWVENVISMSLELKMKMNVEVVVFRENGDPVRELLHQENALGKVEWSFDTTGCVPGKYYFEIITPNEKALRYFVID